MLSIKFLTTTNATSASKRAILTSLKAASTSLSVRDPLDENQIRETLLNNGFKIIKNTQKPAKLNWNLRINKRTQLNYKVDLIIAQKNS